MTAGTERSGAPGAAQTGGDATLAARLAGWASGLTLDDVPPRVVPLVRSQVLSALAAARATLAHPLGERVVRALGPPVQDDPKAMACTLAALTIALEFDEALYAGHSSHSTVNVPLAYARPLGLDGERLLAAVVAGNECSTRVTAAATLGRYRGQTAGHAHLAGAVAARLHAERAPAERWVDALGLAFAAPPWTLLPAFLASDAKALFAMNPVRTALDACDAANAGMRGFAGLLEHPDGFLAKFADAPIPELVVAGFGERWHSETPSFKVHPGSAYLDSAVDCAVELHAELDGARAAQIEDVVVHGSIFTLGIEVEAKRYCDGPDSSPAALTFSVSYAVATALLNGAHTPADLAPPAVRDPERWALAERIRFEHDLELTRRSSVATTPVGDAVRSAGEAGAEWMLKASGGLSEQLGDLGEPEPTFEHATKEIGARVEVRLANGRTLVRERVAAVGAIGDETRARHGELMRAKFLATGGAADVADAVARLEQLPAGELAELVAAALA